MTIQEFYEYKIKHEQNTGNVLKKIWLTEKDIVELMVECNQLVRQVAGSTYSVSDNFILLGVEVRHIEVK